MLNRRLPRRLVGSIVGCAAVLTIVACGAPEAGSEGAATVGAEPGAVPATRWESADLDRRRGRPELMASLRQAAAAERHPGDDGGSAWLETTAGDGSPPVKAGATGRWRIRYEAGPHGVDVGGRVLFQVSPFWGWSSPQLKDPNALGFSRVTTTAEGVTLDLSTPDQQLLAITIGGRPLRSGEQLLIDYGASPRGALADRFAEDGSRFWIAVDSDGDGVRQVLKSSPAVDVVAGPAASLLLFLPSTAHPGEEVRLAIALVDARGNGGVLEQGEAIGGTLELSAVDGADLGASLRSSIDLSELSRGEVAATWQLALRPRSSGTLRLRGRLTTTAGVTLEGESNPLQVAERGARILWADLQNHSAVSDGTGRPQELFAYARDVAALDVFSLTDHDHWGMLFYDEHRELWQEAIDLTEGFHAPGRFVTVVGFEWTHWVFGHRHVLDFAPPYVLLSSLDPRYETPTKLWAGLAAQGGPALTVAHHSAGGPVATDWSIPPDPRFEPITEIVSVHGSSEALDAPGVIYQPVPGNFVRDALDKGYALGFIGSSDGHDGHPGLGHLASSSGGLAAILSEDLSRQGVYEALTSRRVYATNGPRIILRSSFGGFPMGSDIPLDGSVRPPVEGLPANTLVTQVIAPGELEYLDVIRSGGPVGRLECDGRRVCSLALPMDDLQPTEYLYVRAVQQDGGAAWSSPFFFTASGPVADGPSPFPAVEE